MDVLLPLAFVVPLGAAALVVGLGHVVPQRVADAFAVLAGVITAVLCAILVARSADRTIVHWFGGWTPRAGAAIGVDFAADQFGAGLATLVAVLFVAAMVFSWRYFDSVRTLFHALMLVFCAAMVGFCLSGDLFNMFVFFELMSVSAYALTGYKNEERGALQGALNFAITNSIAAFMVLLGIALVYARTGALNLAQIHTALSTGPVDGLIVCAMMLLIAGFLVKAAIVPFHFWLADAHAVAPTPVCMLFSGVMVQLGIFAVVRIYWTALAGVAPPSTGLRALLVGAGVLTAVTGAVMCLGQHHLKRLLALSTVSHAGIVLVGVGLLDGPGLSGAAVYAVGHGLVKAGLFACAGIILHRKGWVDDHRLHGKCRDMPATAVLWALGAAALAGMPPFSTYLGKGLLDEASRSHHVIFLEPVMVFASACTAAAVFRAGAHLFLGWGQLDTDATAERQGRDEQRETRGSSARTPPTMIAVAGTLLLAAAAFGLAPGMAVHSEAAASSFTDTAAYTAAVLGNSPQHGHIERAHPPRPSLSMVVSGLLSTIAALVIAAVSLWHDRLPRRLTGASHAIGAAPVRQLRSLHSGHIGDYVAWLVVGTATFGGLLALSIAR